MTDYADAYHAMAAFIADIWRKNEDIDPDDLAEWTSRLPLTARRQITAYLAARDHMSHAARDSYGKLPPVHDMPDLTVDAPVIIDLDDTGPRNVIEMRPHVDT